jgi:hypothetical protein
MTQAILHAPSGAVEVTLPLPEGTQARERLVYMDKEYALSGVQDGVAHYQALWRPPRG